MKKQFFFLLTSIILLVSCSDAVTQLVLIQQPSNSNIPNFYQRFVTKDRDFDFRHQTFHRTLDLLNKEYSDIVELKLRKTYWGEPYTRIYLKSEFGILGYETDGELWIQK